MQHSDGRDARDWAAQRTEAARIHAERLQQRRDAEHDRAEALLARFVAAAHQQNLPTQPLRVQGYGGKSSARTPLHVLESLSVTALVLYGSQDAITGAKEHEAMAAALGTEAVVVDGAGHLSAVEAPDQVAAALTDLYRRSTQGTQAGPA